MTARIMRTSGWRQRATARLTLNRYRTSPRNWRPYRMRHVWFIDIRFLMSVIFIWLSASSAVCRAEGGNNPESERNPWLWPFSIDSIWNTPIGSNAEYEDAGLRPTRGVGADPRHFLELSREDPERKVIGFDRFAPKNGRCSGTTDMNGLTVHLPDGWTVPDIGPDNPYGLKPNSAFTFRLYGNDRVWNGPAIARCDPRGALYMYSFVRFPDKRIYEDLHGDGNTDTGGQGASRMSGMGGTIRVGELTGERPLRHAIKLNVWGHHLYYGDDRPGYKWPATAADHYANQPDHKNRYVGKNPNLVMGTLLAVEPGVTAKKLGLRSEPARLLLKTLQGYGAYITEDSGWDVWDIIVESDVMPEFEKKYGFGLESEKWEAEVLKIAPHLKIVVNNGPDSVGGGGRPLRPLAPPLRSEK